MSGESEHSPWRADLAAYMLGSLDEDEQLALEQHLEECQACREELAWLRPAIDLLPESVEQVDPPPELRARLMAEVRSDAAEAGAPAAAESKREKPAAPGFLRGLLLRPATGLAAIALVAAGVGGYALNEGGSGSGDSTTTISSNGPGALRATLERSGDSGTLKLTGMEQATPTHVYEAWVQRGNQVKPSSLFDARHNGTASVALQKQLAGADAVMVTLEPRGGSRQPTSPAIVSVSAHG